VTARPGLVQLTVVYGDALIESIMHQVKDSFKEVYIINAQQDNKKYDYIVSITKGALPIFVTHFYPVALNFKI
jgi:hypothetical protein